MPDSGIFIGVGGNLATSLGSPLLTCQAAVAALAAAEIAVVTVSPWYGSAPQPPSDQPWYVNAVAAVDTTLAPTALLARLHAVEARFGRERSVANAARTVDLDLLAYQAHVTDARSAVALPHPRLHQRAFVLLPLADIAPTWRHPVLGVSIATLIAALPPDQQTYPLEPGLDPAAAAPLVSKPRQSYTISHEDDLHKD